MPRLVQLVHGYPPRELAGTEIYTRRVTEGLRRRGWEVLVIASTRAPGRDHGTVHAEGGVARVVNNLPWRPLAQIERDTLVEGRVHGLMRDFGPDLVHVQHLLFLSAHLEMPCPSIATLHDAWGWCPRSNLLFGGRELCPGPSEERCPDCYAPLCNTSSGDERLSRLAGAASRLVEPETLHAAWRRVPAVFKAMRPGHEVPVGALGPRQEAVAGAFQRLDRRLAPSRYLADLAADEGLGEVLLLPHGVDPGAPRRGGEPPVFLGSLVPHKGAHLVNEAVPEALIFGPATDASYVAGLSNLRGPVPNEEVPDLLAAAEALVLGSTWPENAPLVVLEARASGCPVVAPRIGGLPESIEDGVDGVLYEPGDVEDLRRAMRSLRERPHSPRPPMTFESHLDGLLEHYEAVLT
ncbi:MAG TPA: glycosyltransferase [Myxococcota bacterium]|nr:glycosyltransferase [Myxococcota bacterium]